ncbi:carotenoid ester lipase [Pseudovirgaria hyperparasitica]|uniref:Carotenoid ester lipase n=1 Tax=Pseudovirgaria hyperparasitica TaxID=470096 RepID=A0A6A6W0D2_9PEZI|nr:carotenoid ester lipase [Pseudovirgaria hyperparasitica]KAF2756378.1 carotenoid ester lipase [Pseudovirgaria hyperparasitica]
MKPCIRALWPLCFATLALAKPVKRDSPPNIDLDYGTFKGIADPVSHSWGYLGMPYAEAGRFEHAQLFSRKLEGIQDATHFGPACTQKSTGSILAANGTGDLGIGAAVGFIEEALYPLSPQSEDCLLINIQVPENTRPDAKLPIIMWIHGGGFEIGAPYAALGETLAAPGLAVNYRPAGLVQTAVETDQPIIVASISYRLNAFGFSASKEMEEAGLLNLGIEDQRVAMQWIKKHISKFGRDPDKLTIFGESAGSWSVSTHLLWDGGKQDLFRAAIAVSGGPVMVDGPERQQATFDRMVANCGCTDAADKIACLKKADHADISAAVNEEEYFLGASSLASTWTIRPDGKHLTDSPHRLAAQGKFAKVPLMIGDMRDEGTLFSLLTQLKVTTEKDFKDYFQSVWWPKASDEDMAGLMDLYPHDPTKGSPFGTGIFNNPTPNYKRVAALVGDFSFEAQRRNLLAHYPAPAWNYLTEVDVPSAGLLPNNPLTKLPILGSFHAFDVFFYMFANLPRQLSKNVDNRQATAISFVRTLDPNNHGRDIPYWPQWTGKGRETYHFLESGPGVIRDDYRVEQMEYINAHPDSFLI